MRYPLLGELRRVSMRLGIGRMLMKLSRTRGMLGEIKVKRYEISEPGGSSARSLPIIRIDAGARSPLYETAVILVCLFVLHETIIVVFMRSS